MHSPLNSFGYWTLNKYYYYYLLLLFNSLATKITKFSIFPRHNYLFIICEITYNLGKINHVTKWFSKLCPQFHSDDWVSIFSPYESFILTLCLENNNLVMLIILNFIPDRRSSKNCILYNVRTTGYIYSQGHRTWRWKRTRS